MKPTSAAVLHQIAKPRLVVPLGGIRQYTATRVTLLPTALARAERASDLKAHPESALTQEKLPDKKGNRHWSEENATLSEADVSSKFKFKFDVKSGQIKADREAEEAKSSATKTQDKKA
ncbi:hypothetical protein AYO21_01525 [Fonsecaea monophora]|uniref:Uncharacterized protein n=1 Tax=Fonsecaea monophora TaxID=254056 RepID=A0A177FIM7_9EURO|nr:hypothetical protein AYO21_01525 [Fonsecaea monophora]OAG44068.1 hypothetical protein AYO21_01525 [Fonsecaea monophora]